VDGLAGNVDSAQSIDSLMWLQWRIELARCSDEPDLPAHQCGSGQWGVSDTPDALFGKEMVALGNG